MKVLKNQKIWVCWKYVTEGERKTKEPYAVAGYRTGTSADHSGEWAAFDVAAEALADTRRGFDGIGFIMPEGYFLLDVDHKDVNDPMVKELQALFPTYLERSPSGNGFHFYGKVDISRIPQTWDEAKGRWKVDKRYYTKNPRNGLELYIGGLTNRFATYTGVTEGAEQICDCTDAVLTFLDRYMVRPKIHGQLVAADNEKYITLTEDDIPTVIGALRQQKNGAKFAALFDDGIIPDGKSQSEADAALCAMIAFRAGPNPELIDAIFRQSALYREKWDRSDYANDTITLGIRACNGVYHHSLRVVPDFVITDAKGRLSVSATRLADYVNKHCTYLLVTEAQRGSYKKYVYKDGVYRLYSDDRFKGVIRQQISEYDQDLVKMSVVDEAFKIINTGDSDIEASQLNTDESCINFQNGLLDIRTLNLLPHDPAVLSTVRIKARWMGKPTPTPVFDAYLDILLNGDEAAKTLLLEFIGAAISNVRGSRMKKALFMYGPGDTGKSQLKRLTEMLLGDGNYTGIDLQQMEARFGTSAIYGRRLAGSSDMSFMTVSELKIFKKATGGDALFAEFKGQDGFEFVYNGLLWFCMNELPKFGGDDGKWVYDRILPIHCPNVIPEPEQDSELLDKMYAEREGIVYKAVTAFKAVIERGYRFTEPESSRTERKDYQAENNTALEFFRLFMVKRTGSIGKTDPFTVRRIYRIYDEWYIENYGPRYKKSQKEFFKAIAGYLGLNYENMKVRQGNGIYLSDYTIDEVACQENEVAIPLV